MPEEQHRDAEEKAEEQETPTPDTDQKAGWASAHRSDGDDVQKGVRAPGTNSAGPSQSANIADESELALEASCRGLVRGIVYSADSGSALIDETIVPTGSTIDGVKVVRVHSGGVDFEKDGRRWTQRVSEQPNSLWR
jgi:hypothetical protein